MLNDDDSTCISYLVVEKNKSEHLILSSLFYQRTGEVGPV